MRIVRRFVVPAIVLAAAVTACTGDGSSTVGSSAPGSSSAQPTDVGSTTITPGHFRYQNAGLQVELQLEGHDGTMEVRNGSGFGLGKPDLYVLDGVTGARIDGKVLDAQPVGDGAEASFDVQFPPEVTPKSLGLVILLFGSDNYGAFAPSS